MKKEGTNIRNTPLYTTIAVVIVALGIGFALGVYKDRWIGYVGSLVGVPRSTETINLSSVQETYQYLKANFDGDLDTQALIDGANKGLVEAAGDIHTSYLPKDEADEFSKGLEGDVGAGIGVVIGLRSDRVTVTKVLEDNAAAAAGIKQGDVIVSVNDDATDGWDSETASSKIRGEEGTSVKLQVLRDETLLPFTITRQVINNPSVSGEVRDGVGIMTISRFDSQTGALARKVGEDFKKQGVKGVIVDIRGDGGGYLNAAVDVAGLWLSDKLVVSQKQQGQVISQEKTSLGSTILSGTKTIVLVNGGTASASEILAAALRDHGAATLLGETTYGKGSVQQLVSIGTSGALLKVTVAHWYTPDDQNVDKKGLTPDRTVKLTDDDANAGRDPQLNAAIKSLAS